MFVSCYAILCVSGGLHLWGHMCGLWDVHRMYRTAMGEAAHLCNLGCCDVSLANVARARWCDWILPIVLAVS